MKSLFVTGTDTGIGKTRVAVTLLAALARHGLSAAGMKPVASGCRSTDAGLRNADAEALLAASSVRLKYADVNPYAFAPAIAPHIAAAEAGQVIDLAVLEHCHARLAMVAEYVVVEGAGGWLTPLGPGTTLADFAAQIDARVVLVVGLRLGCLNHALLTAQAIRSAGLELAGWIGNAIDPAFERAAANVATLRSRIPAPCLGLFHYSPASAAPELAGLLTLEPLLQS